MGIIQERKLSTLIDMIHTPVLLKETIQALDVKPEGLYIDCTAGEGGHSKAIADLGGKVLAFDWDIHQVTNLQNKYADETGIRFVHANYATIEAVAKEQEFCPVDGILFDYGLSMKQIALSGRGFSFKQKEEPLDMRISEQAEETAQDIIVRLQEGELYDIFAKYSEELHSQAIAKAIKKGKIRTVGDLTTTIDRVLAECTYTHSHSKEATYARIFQALRIVVNHEFDNIEKGLEGALNILKPEGKIVIITFHSLEDRIVKQFAKKNQLKLRLVKNKGDGRRELRSFERSAKLRILSKR